MTKNTRLYFICIIMALSAVTLAGYFLLKTVWGIKNPDSLLKQKHNITLEYSSNSSTGTTNPFRDQVQNLEDLKKVSQVMIQAKVTNERTMSLKSTETKIIVEKIYKDDTKSIRDMDHLYLIEPFSIVRDEIFTTTGYQMVKDGEEYIFFLNQLQAVPGYHYTKKEQKSFMPSSLLYSRYCVSSKEEVKTLLLQKQNMNYNNYSNYAFFSDDKNVPVTYSRIFKSIPITP